MDSVASTLAEFVRGELGGVAFYAWLLEGGAVEELLTRERVSFPGQGVNSSAYHYLLGLDLDDPEQCQEARLVVQGVLKTRGTQVEVKQEEWMAAFEEVCPDWLDVDLRHVRDVVRPVLAWVSGDALREGMRAELLQRFRCLGPHPDWIQSPARWPIGDEGPLVFLGALEVEGYFHDSARAYVFHDPATGRIVTELQVA